MATLDLDAARAARAEAEAKRKPPTLKLGGKTFTLPANYPLAAAWAADENDPHTFLEALLGEQLRDFVMVANADDYLELQRQITSMYIVDPGEASASSPSSARNGRRSGPTSGATTASTSRKRAGD